MEENFTLAAIVFGTGFIATLVTLIFIVAMHRYWERWVQTMSGHYSSYSRERAYTSDAGQRLGSMGASPLVCA